MSIYSYGQRVDILSSWKEDAQNRLLEINKLEEKMHTLLSLNARLVEDAERMADWAHEDGRLDIAEQVQKYIDHYSEETQ